MQINTLEILTITVMSFQRHCIYCPIPLLFILFFHYWPITSASLSKWNDAYDSGYLRRDYLRKYCSPFTLGREETINLEHFLNCSRSGLSSTVLNEGALDDLTEDSIDELYEKNKIQFESWCSTWSGQRDCEKTNMKYIDKCFSQSPSISVGFDILNGFFESACTNRKKKGTNLAYLMLFRKSLKAYWWYNERDVVACFNELSLEFYKRDINKVLGCLKYEFRHRSCPPKDESRELCENLLKILASHVKESYVSSGYVYLINLNMSLISLESFPLVSDLSPSLISSTATGNNNPNSNCTHSKFAYIAFFALLAVVLISLAAMASLKVRFLTFSFCFQNSSTHEILTQHQEEKRSRTSSTIEL